MILVVIDTNIILSALGWGGTPGKVIDLCLEGKCKMVVSQPILQEIEDVLNRPCFGFIASDLKKEFLITLSEMAEIINPSTKISASRDPKDDKFIEVAIAAGAKYIVSGDKDLLTLKSYGTVTIITAAEFVKRF